MKTRNRIYIIGLVIVTLLLCAALVPIDNTTLVEVAYNEAIILQDLVEPPSEEEIREVLALFKWDEPIENVSMNPSPRRSRGSLMPVYEIQVNDNLFLQCDAKTGALQRFHSSYAQKIEDLQSGITSEERITEEQAKKIADTVLGALVDSEILPENAEFRMLDEVQYRGSPEGCLDDSYWAVGGGYYYDDIPMMAYANVNICAYSGRITSFMHWPFVQPEEQPETISAKQAEEIALDHLPGGGNRNYKHVATAKYYAIPKSHFKWLRSEKCLYHLSWMVEFVEVYDELEHEHPIELYVDCATGKVILEAI